jgi:hypothetical protein
MKVRNGFVSNSSSSSFLVVFDKLPDNENELKELMFPEMSNDDHITIYDRVLHVGEVINRVFSDLQNNKKFYSLEDFTENDIQNHFGGWDIYEEAEEILKKEFPKLNDMRHQNCDKYTDDQRREAYEQFNTIQNNLSNVAFKEFFEKHLGKVFVEFDYSDNEGDEVLEHYGIFNNLPNKTTSHH